MRPQHDLEELLCPCWCGAEFDEIPAEMVRRRETWECSPVCRATFDKRGARFGDPRSITNRNRGNHE